jgi:PAS domain S-box-containing protein
MKQLWRTIVFSGLLLLLLVYLLLRSSSADLQLRMGMQAQLRDCALRDAELTRDAMQARTGLLRDYDALAADRRHLLEAVETLRATSSAGDDDTAAALRAPLAELARAVDAKLTDVERFKSDDALLRNSVAYLTYTIARLDAQPGARPALAGDIGDVSSTFLRFIQSPDSASAADFQAVLARISTRGDADDDVRALLAHGNLVADLLPKVMAVLHRIVAAPTTERLDRLQAAVEGAANAAEAQARVFRYMQFFVALVLLAYLLRQFARLRAYGRDLQRSNAGLSREIAERTQAETALRESEQRFRAIAESAHDAIITTDADGVIVSWNPAAEAIFGYSSEEARRTPILQLMPERLRAAAARQMPRPDTGTSFLAGRTIESIGLRRDGREFPYEASIAAWRSVQGAFVTAIVRDITERKQLEETARRQQEKLVQANKMTALGTLVSGVAHEINNPNQLVLFNSGLLADTWRDACVALDEHHREDAAFTLAGLPYAEMRAAAFTLISDMKDGALRIDRIVQDLKDFARPQRQALPVAVDVNQVVERAVRLLAHLIRKRTTRFEARLAPGLQAVRGDAQQLEQVVVNLLVNALEALPEPARGVSVATRAGAGGAVVVEVADEGVGIPPQHLERLCDPFFTTKQDSGGTGLGLSVTFSLVQAHGGRLDFESEPGRGTRAVVTLPGADAARPGPES